MSVYTPLSEEELSAFLRNYDLGELTSFEGIADGVCNSNFFVQTTQRRLVATLFEDLPRHELPFFVDLLNHLKQHGLPVPEIYRNRAGDQLNQLAGKPAIVAEHITGASVMTPDARHCAIIGEALAHFHLSGADFGQSRENHAGLRWLRDSATLLKGQLPAPEQALMKEEVRFQALFQRDNLPQGLTHSDLFRDNVLFRGHELGAMLDFYSACQDALLYDVAVAVNDWCVTDSGLQDEPRVTALLEAYHAVRPFRAIERGAWPVMLRAAALRFWLARLQLAASQTNAHLSVDKPPQQFERILRHLRKGSGRLNRQLPR